MATDLQDSVVRELRFDQRIDATRIGVTTKDTGVVTLTGVVPSYLEKLEAERVAKRVHGVKAVANELQVNLPLTVGFTDTDLAERALEVLRWRSGLPADRLKIGVSGGWVTIEGDVDFLFQKQEAEHAIGNLRGVMGLTNKIRVSPTQEVSPDDVEREIREALVRNARLDAKGIEVRTDGSRVVLEGTVTNWAEAEEAETAAWFAPGVTAVENRLHVGTAP